MPHYDLLLKNGHVIDPANKIDAPMDVAIADGSIAAVAADIPSATADKTVDVSGLYVTPGLIDIHVHVYHTREPETLSIIADHHSFRSGLHNGRRYRHRRRQAFPAFQAHRYRPRQDPHLRFHQHCQIGHDRPL